jgi:hypothetical protein
MEMGWLLSVATGPGDRTAARRPARHRASARQRCCGIVASRHLAFRLAGMPAARAAERALVVRSAIINTVAINPHGETLATSIDDEVRLWDLASMHQIGPALPEPEHVDRGIKHAAVSAHDTSGG